MQRQWHQMDIPETFRALNSSSDGLTEIEVVNRQVQYGTNELVEQGRRGAWHILLEQFIEPMVWLLIVAAVVSLFIHEYVDAAAVVVIVLLNALLGFFQDYRAEKAMAALKLLAVPEVQVRRSGGLHKVKASQLVPGDVVLLEAGNRVPADCRLTESHRLQITESALTGESQSVIKQTSALGDRDLAIADRTNLLFMGTDIESGRAEAVVYDIGMSTELGKIAKLIQGVKTQRTPLQRRLARMSKWLAFAAIGIVCIVFVQGLMRGQPLTLMLMTALSMAVAAVPEGLPAVATIALAIGAKRMLRRHALVRKLPAVETLGSVTVICCDKTGTLTENQMRLGAIRHGDIECDLIARQTRHTASHLNSISRSSNDVHPATTLALLIGSLCNDAKVRTGLDAPDDRNVIEGDPTEVAFLLAAREFQLDLKRLQRILPRVAEVPFDSHRKRMSTVHQLVSSQWNNSDTIEAALQLAGICKGDEQHLALIKGATDAVLDACSHSLDGLVLRPLDTEHRQTLQASSDALARSGMRVLGLGYRLLDQAPPEETTEAIERDFVFLGFAGLIDPPRAEAKDAVERCKTAGIRLVMITGDHPLTAQNIAGQVGINANGQCLTGPRLDSSSDDELADVVDDVSVFARVSPEHKLRIVEALQKRGHIVAMTGDGVNDAPALKTADIGVAMGITGTDVSKDASETVLLDDNIATIVNSVEEGRVIYDNIRKFLKYTMTSNTGEILVMLVAPMVGMPLPLLPLQILWINLVTDGLPGLALAVEPAERSVMQRKPRSPDQPIMDASMIRHIVVVGSLMGLVSLSVGYSQWLLHPTEQYDASWGTIVFTVLTLSQMGHAMAVRSSRDSLFLIGVLSNPAMLASVLLTLLLQLALIYVPGLQSIFQTQALTVTQLGICLLLSSVVFWSIELEKIWKRRLHRKTAT